MEEVQKKTPVQATPARAYVTIKFDGQTFLLPKAYADKGEAWLAVNRWKRDHRAMLLPDYTFGVVEK